MRRASHGSLHGLRNRKNWLKFPHRCGCRFQVNARFRLLITLATLNTAPMVVGLTKKSQGSRRPPWDKTDFLCQLRPKLPSFVVHGTACVLLFLVKGVAVSTFPRR